LAGGRGGRTFPGLGGPGLWRGGRWRGPCHVIGGMIWDRRRGGWWASRGATCEGVRAGEVTGGAAVGLGGHTGQLAQGRIAAPKCNIYIINTVVVRATSNMDHRSVDIYIYPCTCPVPRMLRGGVSPGTPGAGALRGARPRRHARRVYHVTLRLFKRLSTQNVTQLSEKVAHFVWCFCRARSTPIQKLSPGAISSHFYCILDFYTPNGVGESV
jgi:hypothetical protein